MYEDSKRHLLAIQWQKEKPNQTAKKSQRQGKHPVGVGGEEEMGEGKGEGVISKAE